MVMACCVGNVLYNLVDSLMNGLAVDCFFGSSFKRIACWEDKDLYTLHSIIISNYTDFQRRIKLAINTN